MIAAMVFLGLGLTGILILISDLMFGGAAAAVAGAVTAVIIAVLWFALPWGRRRATE
jgi:hypothetical protein